MCEIGNPYGSSERRGGFRAMGLGARTYRFSIDTGGMGSADSKPKTFAKK
jgi:hypothetical protein